MLKNKKIDFNNLSVMMTGEGTIMTDSLGDSSKTELELQRLRHQIDSLDRDLLKNLNERALLVKAVGKWKIQNKCPIYDPKREAQILQNVKNQNNGPLSDEFLVDFFNELIKKFRQWEAEESSPLNSFPTLENKKILVIGLGLIGASCVLQLRKKIPTLALSGMDPRPPAIHIMPKLSNYFSTLPDPEVLRSFDLIILSTPIHAMQDFVTTKGKYLKHHSLLVDMGSTKKDLCDTVIKTLPAEINYVGLHPMVGRAGGGSAASTPDLFTQQNILVTIPRPIEDGAMKGHKELINLLGGCELEISPDIHDQILAMTSHLPQFLSTTLSLTARDFFKDSNAPLIFGPAFRDMTRLATSEFSMWKDIALTNSKYILQTIALFKSRLENIEEKISTGTFQGEFDLAKDFKLKIQK
ncbi:MAG: prephenate dehydrogenase/arogenate dehydrogenase family protein [Bdellovibrionales bacterium]|nr:prephenate dehydrogenase/arogenate dehydrogenase family protein [Bdellovibrionales bacterium]